MQTFIVAVDWPLKVSAQQDAETKTHKKFLGGSSHALLPPRISLSSLRIHVGALLQPEKYGKESNLDVNHEEEGVTTLFFTKRHKQKPDPLQGGWSSA